MKPDIWQHNTFETFSTSMHHKNHYHRWGETKSRQEDFVINIGNSLTTQSMGAPRNLGVLFDSSCCLRLHMNKICLNVNHQLYSIGKLESTFTNTQLKRNPDKLCILDYCNSLLYGINGYSVSQLQRCRNSTARIIIIINTIVIIIIITIIIIIIVINFLSSLSLSLLLFLLSECTKSYL